MATVIFDHPLYLRALFLVPLLIIIHFVTLRLSKSKALRFANFEAIGHIRGVDFFSKNIVLLFLSILIVASATFAAAGMKIERELDTSSYAFVIALDISKSMEASDLLPNRFEAARAMALSFVDATPPYTPIGIVSFSSNALVELEPSADKEIVKQTISELSLSNLGGTDLYEAVVTSTNLLLNEETRALIVLSDGQLNIGTIEDVITYANEHQVVVHTVVLGSSLGGATSYGVSKADEDSLKSLAYNTKGSFFRATSSEELANSVDTLVHATPKKVFVDVRAYLTLIFLGLFVLFFILVNTRYHRIP